MTIAVEGAQKLETFIERISPMLTEYGVRVAGALILLAAAWIGSGWFARWMRGALEAKKIEQTLARFLSKIARWLLMIASALACLTIFGVNITSFAAVIASGGLAAGLALQGSLSSLVAGAALSILRPFRIGDVVMIAGQLGKVDDIDLFATRLNTPDNRHIIIPNNQIFGSIIENITRNPVRRVDVDVGVDYTADIDETRRVLERALGRAEGVLPDPPPEALLMKLGPSSVDWQLRAWAKKEDFFAVRQSVTRAAKNELDAAGITIPFPQMILHRPRDQRIDRA